MTALQQHGSPGASAPLVLSKTMRRRITPALASARTRISAGIWDTSDAEHSYVAVATLPKLHTSHYGIGTTECRELDIPSSTTTQPYAAISGKRTARRILSAKILLVA